MTFLASESGRHQLVDELVEAHLDTIELVLDRPDDLAWSPHVRYLQALVRQAKQMTAAAGDPHCD
jgi:hypothetical protein